MDFSSFDPESINSILSSLSPEDMERLSEMAENFFSAEEKKENKSSHSGANNGDFFSFDAESIAKVMSVMNKLKSQPDDSRIRLLYALRPVLTPVRQQRVDQAVQMLRIMSVLTLF